MGRYTKMRGKIKEACFLTTPGICGLLWTSVFLGNFRRKNFLNGAAKFSTQTEYKRSNGKLAED
ncbi:hypothetical protein RhiirA5_506490 [Rhizophagus irregularis]|uniref:Uncharacterized protein n=1 Tax=Rhizophagus irregularis TaxID=588596 RepID=A0A2N0NT45_9GLOM|nr:hypothetical protein RhiirA5_506490 [Rhizophagus irregularis]